MGTQHRDHQRGLAFCGLYSWSDHRSTIAKKIGFFTQFQYFKMGSDHFLIYSFRIMPIIIHQPHAVQTILFAVIANPEKPPHLAGPSRLVSHYFDNSYDREWRNNLWLQFAGHFLLSIQLREIRQVEPAASSLSFLHVQLCSTLDFSATIFIKRAHA